MKIMFILLLILSGNVYANGKNPHPIMPNPIVIQNDNDEPNSWKNGVLLAVGVCAAISLGEWIFNNDLRICWKYFESEQSKKTDQNALKLTPDNLSDR